MAEPHPLFRDYLPAYIPKEPAMTLSERIARIRKAIVSLVGFLTSLLTLNLLPESVAGWVAATVGFLTVVLTWWVPNADAPGDHAA